MNMKSIFFIICSILDTSDRESIYLISFIQRYAGNDAVHSTGDDFVPRARGGGPVHGSVREVAGEECP